MDTTIFGNDVPMVLQWHNPPHSVTWLRDVMYAGFAASLFSTSLAMIGKQWLTQRPLTQMRGSTIQHSQNQQQELNGIASWYFEHVAGPLPSVPQVPVLLLGCALSQYLWEIDTTIAGVVLDVTSFGVISHFFVLTVGMVSKSCPHQMPGFYILHSAATVVMSATMTIISAVGDALRCSETANMFQVSVAHHHPSQSGKNMLPLLVDIPCKLPGTLGTDTFHLGQAMVQPLVAFVQQVYYIQLLGTPSTPVHGSDQKTAGLDLKHVLWMLRSSLDNSIYLSTLEFLTTMVVLDDFDPTLVVDCFNILISCVKVIDGTVVVNNGLEQLATVSAMCFFHTFSHLSVVGPKSHVFGDVCQHYGTVFPPEVDFNSFPFYHTLSVIHRVLNSDWRCRQYARIEWQGYTPSSHEHIIFSCSLAKLAQSEYQRREGWEKKVPRWMLRFVLHSLSLDPLPPAPVIADCLSIIAIDLGCDIPNIKSPISDERYVHA